MIETGKSESAKLVSGGGRLGDKGYFVSPTVFADVKNDMTIAREEVGFFLAFLRDFREFPEKSGTIRFFFEFLDLWTSSTNLEIQ